MHSIITRRAPGLAVAATALTMLLAGSAQALPGKKSVDRGDLQNNVVRSKHIVDGQVKGVDVALGAIGSDQVADESLTGQDVKNQSGVDTCTHGTVRYHELCVGVANEHHNWLQAHSLCAALELRLPSLGEALALVRNHDLPNVDQFEYFWTEEFWDNSGGSFAFGVNDGGGFQGANATTSQETVCVTTPTN